MQKSYKNMKTQIFATFDKANPDTGSTSIRGLNLAAVKNKTFK
jgi:hypothetical protein